MSSTPTIERLLGATEVATLMRVNPNQVSNWWRDPRYPATADGQQRRKTTYEDLRAFCRTARKPDPLPLEILDMSPADVAAAIQHWLNFNGRPPGSQNHDPARQVRALEEEAAALRQALREHINAATNLRGASASSDRALNRLLDMLEASRSDTRPSL